MSLDKAIRLFISSCCFFCVSLNSTANQNSTVNDAEVLRVLDVSQDIAYGEYLSGECAACHSAVVTSGSNVPVIKGVAAIYLVRALLEYRAGTRDNTTMINVASALSDEEIAVLAHYLESQTP